MVMVSSAVLGAAAGTGLALLLAVTIVMYRYYLLRRRGKVSIIQFIYPFYSHHFVFHVSKSGVGRAGSLGRDAYHA